MYFENTVWVLSQMETDSDFSVSQWNTENSDLGSMGSSNFSYRKNIEEDTAVVAAVTVISEPCHHGTLLLV